MSTFHMKPFSKSSSAMLFTFVTTRENKKTYVSEVRMFFNAVAKLAMLHIFVMVAGRGLLVKARLQCQVPCFVCWPSVHRCQAPMTHSSFLHRESLE